MIIAIGIIFGVYVSHAEEKTVTLYSELNFYAPAQNTDLRVVLSENEQALYDDIYNAIKNKQTSLDVSSYNLTLDDQDKIDKTVFGVVFDHPELYWARSAYSLSGYASGEVVAISFVYIDRLSQEDEKAFFSKLDYVIATEINENMSDVEKALVLHNYIADNTTYGYADVYEESFTSYSVLMNNVGVCQGYSLLYNLLLSRVGIEAKYVSSPAMSHGWSMVKIDGKWYHVDVTHDDPIGANPDEAYVMYDNFLCSDDAIRQTGHYDWDSNLPECDDTSFDTGWCFKDYIIRNKMKYDNGKFCYKGYREFYDGEIVQYYYIINGKKYVYECVESNLDGSEKEVKPEEYYDTLGVIEGNKIFKPVRFVDTGVENVNFDDLTGSRVFIKTDSFNTTDRIAVVYYNQDKRISLVKYPDVYAADGYAEFTVPAPADDAVSVKIMHWSDLLSPRADAFKMNK